MSYERDANFKNFGKVAIYALKAGHFSGLGGNLPNHSGA